ncbi:hypothetical protein CLG96_05980 [Sphingomonas oleivorans]|uniref:HTH cro/C1-type domain-containing protein n=1 Tax=Sphingomonas oleivorans TaxID=1735121 RepID=A0A2T5FZI4_9SPHN|nr:helix-turn-helix transcriptional regulator [Sphingomonas oleivorans]PTQ12112.1 hypothetical protein CLG96_05980 [Sphingomonas oleivorans]
METYFVLRNIARMATNDPTNSPANDPAGTLPNNLRAMRKRAGLRQPAIAEALGVSVPQVSRWETGKDGIPSARLPAMANAYRGTIGEIFGEEAPGQPAAAGMPGTPVSAENLEALLAALLPLAPKGRLSDQSLRALAAALSYGLALLGDQLAMPASPDAISVAVRGVAARFRDEARR